MRGAPLIGWRDRGRDRRATRTAAITIASATTPSTANFLLVIWRLPNSHTLKKLEREVEGLKQERLQGVLFDQEERLEHIDRSIEEKQAEINRRNSHYEELRVQLERERERIMKHLLPKRYALSGEAQVFPVSLEVRLPGGEA